MSKFLKSIAIFMAVMVTTSTNAQTNAAQNLDRKQQAIVRISALTGKGDLGKHWRIPLDAEKFIRYYLSFSGAHELTTFGFQYFCLYKNINEP